MLNKTYEEDYSKAVDIIKSTCNKDKDLRIKAFDDLESAIFQHEQLDIPVKHRFCGDMYAREIVIPKNTLLTGKIHKFDHFEIMLSGDIIISTDDGEVKRLTGLNIIESKAGKKRAGWAIEDTHWINFHSSGLKDPSEMADYLTVDSFEDLKIFNEQLAQAIVSINASEQVLTDHANSIISKD